MRSPLRSKVQPRAQVSGATTYPAPVKGWNSSSALAGMRPDEAIRLDNWYPRPAYCEIRGGYSSHATAMTGNGKTLLVYNRLNGTNTMFCATSAQVYNVTSAGAVGASVAARTEGRHRWTMFGDGTNNWLIACNGTDKPLYYDGTNWVAVDGVSVPALTVATTTTLWSPHVFKGRLLFIQKNTLSFWYLTAGAAGGALTEFPLDGEATKGGYLLSMATWTRDGGAGMDDFAVFLTTQGEALVYQGTDPSDATKWAKVGTFFLGKPLGDGIMTPYGADLVVTTENGAFLLSSALATAAVDPKFALSLKIEDAFTAAARTYGAISGWKSYVYPAQSALIVNVPKVADGAHDQYVMNTITKAWCRFTNWPAEDFAVFNGALYFCNATAVYKAWSGTSDNGSNIVADAKTAFSNFKTPGRNKQFKMMRPVMSANGTFSFLTDIDVDFKDDIISGSATYTVTASATWDSSTWDGAYWMEDFKVLKEWTSPSEWTGVWAAGKVKVQTNSLTIQWMSTDYIYEVGGLL
jgi:hypothetical protein